MIYEVSYFFGVFNSDYHPQLFLSVREMAKNIFLTTLNGKLNIPKKFFNKKFLWDIEDLKSSKQKLKLLTKLIELILFF